MAPQFAEQDGGNVIRLPHEYVDKSQNRWPDPDTGRERIEEMRKELEAHFKNALLCPQEYFTNLPDFFPLAKTGSEASWLFERGSVTFPLADELSLPLRTSDYDAGRIEASMSF